jgi:hypothetical protein
MRSLGSPETPEGKHGSPRLDEQNHKQQETDPCGHSEEGKFIGHCVLHQLGATAEDLLRASRAENGSDGRRLEQQEHPALLAKRPPISKRTNAYCGSI